MEALESMVKENQVQTGRQPGEQKSPGHTKLIVGIVVLLVLAALAVILVKKQAAAAKAKAGAAARAAQAPVPVVAGKVIEKDVPIYLDGLGTVQAFNTVTVRARVDGAVAKGGVCRGPGRSQRAICSRRLIPRPIEAALEQAVAKKAQDEAQLANAQMDLKREAELLAAKIDSAAGV